MFLTDIVLGGRQVPERQIRSSAWLEHYTDNVGVSSSNLLGSTLVLKG